MFGYRRKSHEFCGDLCQAIATVSKPFTVQCFACTMESTWCIAPYQLPYLCPSLIVSIVQPEVTIGIMSNRRFQRQDLDPVRSGQGSHFLNDYP